MATLLSKFVGGGCACDCDAAGCCVAPDDPGWCVCCGFSLNITVNVTCEDSWSIDGEGAKAPATGGGGGGACGCLTDNQTSGFGPEMDVTFDIDGYWWQENDCCVDFTCNGMAANWADNVVVTDCQKVADTTDPELVWGPHIDQMAPVPSSTGFEMIIGTECGLNCCCNCDWSNNGGAEVSVFITNIDSGGPLVVETVTKPNDCLEDLCVWNRHGTETQQQYIVEYTSIISNTCCTNEPTGTQTGRTELVDFWGVDGYVMKGWIDTVFGTDLDGYTITSAGGRDLFFRFATSINNTANFLGRINVVIEGEECDGNLVQTDSWTAASYSEADVNCDNCFSDRINAGGLGQWVPDLTSNYKRFKVTMTAQGWDWGFGGAKFCGGIGNPSTEAVASPDVETTVIWVDIDAAFYTCP